MVWTRFMDMHSGGGAKEAFEYLYIEASREEAEVIFYNRFGHNPNRVSCTCCGADYSISDEELTLEAASEYDRKKTWNSEDRISVGEFITNKIAPSAMSGNRVEFIFAKDIAPEERVGDLPTQGYVWRD